MATITVQQRHQLDRDEALRRVRTFEAGVLKDFKITARWGPDKYTASLAGPVTGRVLVRNTDVVFQLVPGFLAKRVVGASRIEAELKAAAAKALA